MREVAVNLGSRSYTIHIGAGLMERISHYLPKTEPAAPVTVVTDTNVSALYGDKVKQVLGNAGFTCVWCEVPAGEDSKSLDMAKELYTKFLLGGVDRTSTVVALGGGVVGDLAGFVAATYMRGIPYIQVPTTLLAQVDSSVGGKVGLNLSEAKNVVGSFYQPYSVVIDTSTLNTLPEREFRAGLAEVVKYGVISDANLFERVETEHKAILSRDHDILEAIIETCCRFKATVVEQDERESGIRAILNYGHTIGHAVEAAGRYERFLHGEAVAIGMNGAARIAARIGLADDSFVWRQARLLQVIGLPVAWSDMSVTEVVSAMKLDKKRAGGALRFVLPRELGCVTVRTGIDDALITEVIEGLRRGGL